MLGGRVRGGRVWLSGRVGEARVAGPGLRAMVGACGPLRGEWGGRGWGGGCVGGRRCVGVCVRLRQRSCVVTCRPGDLEERLAVFCDRGKGFANERAYLVQLLVGGGKRVF